MKAFVAFVVILILVGGGIVGYFVWERMNRVEKRGVGLEMTNPVPEDKRELLEQQYNLILDRDEVLQGAFDKHGIKDYYGLPSSEKAMEKFREDTVIEIPKGNQLQVLFFGKRLTRSLRDETSRTLASDFMDAVKTAESN